MPNNEEILNYVMNTPNNTNPAVLRDMLNNNSGNPGYNVETVTKTIIPEQTVTLEGTSELGKNAFLMFAEGVDAAPETLSVVLNGDEYELTKEDYAPNAWLYELPLGHGEQIVIGINPETGEFGGSLHAGYLSPLETVTISATTVVKQVTVTDDFKDAVDFCTGYSIKTDEEVIIPEQTVAPTMGDYYYEADLTLAEGVAAAPDSMTIIANGVEYTTTVTDIPQISGKTYETDDFSIVIGLLNPGDTNLSAQIYGPSLPESITIKASNKETTITVTDSFKDAVTAAGAGTFFIGIEFDGDSYTMRETWATIMAASAAGKSLVGVYRDGASAVAYFPIIGVSAGEDSYMVRALGYNDQSEYGPLDFMTNTSSGYPEYGRIA